MKQEPKKRYAPFTPGGSVVIELAGRDEKVIWRKLLEAMRYMGYQTIDDLKERGYTVEEI